MTTKNYLQQYISQKVKYFRTQNKMSQEELSEQAGLGLKYINQLENQNVNLTIHSLEKVIDALEMTPEEFFNFDSLESTSDKSDNLSLKRINMKIKGWNLFPVFFKNIGSIQAAEVFPVKVEFRKETFCCLNKLVNEVVVTISADPFVTIS